MREAPGTLGKLKQMVNWREKQTQDASPDPPPSGDYTPLVGLHPGALEFLGLQQR